MHEVVPAFRVHGLGSVAIHIAPAQKTNEVIFRLFADKRRGWPFGPFDVDMPLGVVRGRLVGAHAFALNGPVQGVRTLEPVRLVSRIEPLDEIGHDDQRISIGQRSLVGLMEPGLEPRPPVNISKL
jgi:hypothetical protein